MSVQAKVRAAKRRQALAQGLPTRRRVTETSRAAVAQGAAYASSVSPISLAKSRSIPLMVIGWSLLLILVYLLIAKPNVTNALGSLSSVGVTATKVWVSPVDPLQSLGAAPPSGSSSPTTSPGGGGQSGGTAGATPGVAPAAHPAPAPSKIQRTSIRSLEKRYGVVATLPTPSEVLAAHKGVAAPRRVAQRPG